MADTTDGRRTGAVVLHYRRPELLAETLSALQAQQPPVDRIVVVDNASGTAAAPRVPAGVELLQLPDNRGYSGGMNAGIRHLGDGVELLLLLTHECVLGPGAVARLAAEVGDGSIGLVAPVLVSASDPDQVFGAGGELVGLLRRPQQIGHGTPLSMWNARAPFDVDFADGACVLLTRRAVAQTGLWDEAFFLYYEDVDYGLRLRAAGLRVVCVPEAVAAAAPGYLPPYAAIRSRLLLARRHFTRARVAALVAYAALLVVVDAIRPLSAFRRWRLGQRWHGLRDGLTGRLAVDRYALPVDPTVLAALRT